MWPGIQKNVRKSSREEEILPKIMILDPKEVSRPKMSLIEVVRRHKIDFGTKLQVLGSMYEVRNPKNVRKSAQVTKGCVTSLKTAFEQNDRLISYVAGFKR